MATPGIIFELSETDREHAIAYVKESGFFKNRLANFLGISRPTLDKILEEDTDFFTSLKRADSVFCKNLIDKVAEKNPIFILRTRYKDEFNERIAISYDPEEEIHKLMKIIDEANHEPATLG